MTANMKIGLAVLLTAALAAIPYALQHAGSQPDASTSTTTTADNPFAAAVSAVEPVAAIAGQIALATPAGQIAQAVAPVVAPVAVVKPKPVRKPQPKPQPVAEPEPRDEIDDMAEADKMQNLWVCDNKTVEVEIDVPDPVKPVERSAAGMLLGGAAGALFGSQIGGGNGKTLATIASAAGGAWAGDRMANLSATAQPTTHKEKRTQVVEVCGWQATRLPDEVLRANRQYKR